MPLDPERQFVRLIFDVSKKYPSWDPEVPIEVGDYGRITAGNRGIWFWKSRKGTFLKEGNIYQEEKWNKFEIPKPTEYGTQADEEGLTWIVSQNAIKIDFDAQLTVFRDSRTTPAFAGCGVKTGFHFFSSPGAILAMKNDTITTIDPPGTLRSLAKDSSMVNRVIVSEVHRCSSYMRALTSFKDQDIFVGVSAPTTVGESSLEGRWVTSSAAGNFRSKVDAKGERTFYPLFRLVTFRGTEVATGLKGKAEEEQLDPLPDATPPWEVASSQKPWRNRLRHGFCP